MISFVRGVLVQRTENSAILDTGGIGFEIFVPVSALEKLPPVGNEVTLYTYMNVKEDEMSLYGFIDRDDLAMFRLLITVSGIGPKGAQAILSGLSADDLRFAILSQDVKAISKAQGVGAKTAQRVIMELKDKVDISDGFSHLAEVPAPGRQAASSERNDAVMALTVLGYSNSDALKAVSRVQTEGKSTEEILHDALKLLGR